MENYFEKFPIFTYSNTACVDISKRVRIDGSVQADLFAYFPYELKNSQRADTIANRYYDDPGYSWLVWLSNQVIDPYYAFPMDDQTFTNFINKKYQNMANAEQKILFWQMNWDTGTEEEITPAFYENTLPEPLKKYYEAVYGENTRVVYYRRRKEDWQVSTNQILRFDIENTSGNGFTVGEVVKMMIGNTVQSNSYVTFANSSQVMVQHPLGNVQANAATTFIRGQDSNTTANVIYTTYVANNISEDEAAYWGPVYAYEYELGLNEKRKFIQLIDQRYSLVIAEKLRKELKT